MRLINLLSLIFLLTSLSVSAQSIVAGVVQPGQYSVDIQPDTTIKAPYAVAMSKQAQFPLDMNGDGIVDFELHVFNNNGLGIKVRHCYILPLNDNEVAIAYTDSCFSTACDYEGLVWEFTMVRAFDYGQIIDNNVNWADSLVYLSYDRFFTGCLYCDDQSFADSSTNYIGVRYFTSTDTVYGWIKVKNVGSIAGAVTCTIEAIAGESGTSGTSEIQTNVPNLRVSPNPASDVLHLEFDQVLPSEALLEIWDRFGRPVMQHHLSAHTSRFSPGISTLAEGVYIYSVRSAGALPASGKFVVAR